MPKTLKNKHQFKKNKTHKIRGGGFFDSFDSFNFFKKDDLPFMYFYNFKVKSVDKDEDEKISKTNTDDTIIESMDDTNIDSTNEKLSKDKELIKNEEVMKRNKRQEKNRQISQQQISQQQISQQPRKNVSLRNYRQRKEKK
jgi:hypothetical protein